MIDNDIKSDEVDGNIDHNAVSDDDDEEMQEEVEDNHRRTPEFVQHYVSPTAVGKAMEPEECFVSNNRHTSIYHNPNKPEK